VKGPRAASDDGMRARQQGARERSRKRLVRGNLPSTRASHAGGALER
jgi:hypothetical protein